MKKVLLNVLLFLFSIICFSQSIDLVRFDNTQTYTPGSGVSMHINPTGIFVLDDPSNLSANTNNTFILELSAAGGSFATTTNLGSVDDFYTPLMNGVIPSGTASGEYKLRVRSTNPVTTVESGTFTIDASASSSLPTATTTMGVNTNYFECLNDGSNTINPYFGSLKQAYDATVANMPSGYRFLQIAASNSSNTLNVNLIDIGAGTTTAITATSAGVYTIPDTLAVGTYNFEVEEVDSSGNSSFFSFTFLFHTSATTFGTPGVDIVCTNTEVEFNVDISILGIGRNYMGSYYTFNWGDGTAVETKTHAEILAAYTAPLDLISHTFVQPSCSASGQSTSFEVQMDLYNKGLSVNGTNPSCDEYIANGTGATKEIITSDAPEANFQLDDEQCITENIEAINTTINGSFPAPDGTCSGEPTFTWYYKTPTASDFVPVFSNSPWLVGNDLIIPAEDITIPGCWTIKLSAINPDFCQIEDLHEDTINIEAVPDADFNIIQSGSIVQDLDTGISENTAATSTSSVLTKMGQTWTAGYSGKLTSISLHKNGSCTFSSFPQRIKVYAGDVQWTGSFPGTISNTMLYDSGNGYFSNSSGNNYWNSSNSNWSTSGIGSGWLSFNIPVDQAPTLISGQRYSFVVIGSCANYIVNVDPSNTEVTFFRATNDTEYVTTNYKLQMKTTMLLDPESGQNAEVSQICIDDVVTLTDASNIVSVECDSALPNEDPTYQWTISPNSGYTLINDTTLTSQNPQVTFTSVGNYTITETVTTECGSDSFSSDLEVIGDPSVSFPDESQTYCSTSTLLINFANQLTPTYSTGLNAPTAYTWTVTGNGIDTDDYSFASSTTASDALPTIQLNSFGTYNITVTLDSNCGTDVSDTVTITLSQTPTITNTTTSQTMCSAGASTEFTAVSDVAGTTFSWIATENENLSGYTSTGTTAAIPAQTITNNTNTDQDLVYTITPIADGCGGTPFEYTITVNPVPIIADKDETICSTETFTITPVDDSPTEIVPSGTKYDWGIPVSSPVGAITGGAAAANQTSISQTLTNTTNDPATLTYTVTPDANDCKGDSFDVVITVNPTVGVDAIADQTLCNGDNTLAVGFSTASSSSLGTITYNWTNDNTAIGLASSGTGDIPSFNATSSAVAPIVGTITVTSVYTYNDVICNGESETFTITVNPSPLVNFSEDDQVILTGETTTAVDLTSPTTGVTFAWTVSVPTGITGLTTTTGTNNIPAETLVNTTAEPLTVVYTAVATGDIGFDCEGLPTEYNVTVNPLAQVNPVDDQVVCNEDTLQIEFTTQNTGGITTYSWTNDNSNIGLSNAGTGNIDITATNTTDEPITATVVVTPSFENGGETNTGNSITFTITVNPTGQVDAVSNQIVSNGFDTTAITFSTTNVNGTTTYNWTNSITSIGLAASGTGDVPVFTGINTGSSPVTSTLNVTPTFENGSVDCIGPVEPFEITINPTAQVNPTDDMVVSDGETVTIPFTTINTGGTTTYTWTNTDPTTGLTTTGSSDIGFTAVNTGTSPITTTVVVTPDFENGGNSNTGPTETFTITVNPTAQIDPIDSMVLCNEDDTTAVVFTTENIGGVTTYSWTNDNTSIGLASSGTSTIEIFSVINTTTIAQVATIVVTPTFENGGNSNTGPTETFTITVNPTGQIDAINDIISCDGTTTSGDITFTTQNIDGNTTYSWTNNNTSIGLAADGTGNINSFDLTNTSTETQIATITVTPTYTNNGTSCSGAAEIFTITIPMGQVNAIESQELCSGEQSSEVVFSTVNTEGTTTYTWTNDNTSIGLSSGATGDIPSFTVINTEDTAQVATIVVTPNYNYNGVVCDGPSESFTITVNPGAQVNSIDSQVLCNGDVSDEVIFTTTNTDGITTYNWTNDNSSIGLLGTGSGPIPAFEVVNTSNTAQTAIITVTPTYDNNGVVCIGSPEQFTITVNPSAQVNELTNLNTILCDGEFTPVYTFDTSNTDGITSYNWTNDNPLIGLADSGSGGIPSFSVENTTSSTITALITVIPSYDNNGVVCIGLSNTFTITVNPNPQMDSVEDVVLCTNEISSIITFTSPNTDGDTTYAWTNDNTSIGLTSSGTGDIPSFTAMNLSIVPEFALITVTPTYENNGVVCIGAPQTFNITVLSEIVVSATPSDAVDCDDPNSGSIDLLVSGGSGSYTFLWSNGAETEDLSDIPAGDYSVEVTDSEGCMAQSETFTIWRQDDLIVDLETIIDPNCIGNFVSQINDITVSGGVPPYSINWSNGGSVSIDDNTIMTAYVNGIYTVLVTDSFGCQVETEIIVDFDELGDASFDLISSGQIECGISIFNELLFTNTSSGDYISVTWDFGDGSQLVTGDSVSYTYSNPGAYTVTQTVEYSYGCIEISSEEIEVSDGYDIVLPNAFSPNGDGMNDTIRPVYSCVNSIEMFIYDTFGSLIYYENNTDLIGWNGILEGREAENGNYLMVVKGVSIYQQEINRQGVFTLLR